jgi:5'-nucleotidase
MKKILHLDMDGVLVDLQYSINEWLNSHPIIAHRFETNPDHIPGIFRDPPPLNGAIDAVNKLNNCGKYDLFICTSTPWNNPYAGSDKRFWIEKHFGLMFRRKMFITSRKDMIIGDILIDDRLKNGTTEFKGEFIHFGSDQWPNWNSVLEYLL